MSNKEFADQFGYRNVGITYTDVETLSSLTEVYNSMIKQGTPSFELNKDIELAGATEGAIKELADKLKGINDSGTSGTDFPDADTQDSLIKWLGPIYTNVLNEFKTDLETTSGAPNLLHIPYKIELVSPTEARITTLQDLSNDDLKRNVITGKSVNTSNLDIEIYDASGKITNYNQDKTKLKAATKIRIVEKADKTGEGVKDATKDLENPYIALPLGGVIADGNGADRKSVV